MREFRVKSVTRYIVTDWEDYRGGGSVREIGEASNAQTANEIAATFGRCFPDALVNFMFPRPESYGPDAKPEVIDLLAFALAFCVDGQPLDEALAALPYQIAAAVRRLARYAGDSQLLDHMGRLGVAVDA
jgi:hypothetical protein